MPLPSHHACEFAVGLSSAAWRARNALGSCWLSLSAYPATVRIPCSMSIRRNSGSGDEGGDVTQPQADGWVRLRIYVDLLKGCFQQALKVDSSNARANDAGRIVEQFLRWLSGREEDQDAAQRIDAVDDGGGVADSGRDRLQRDIDNLQDAKFHVLLQRSGRAEVKHGNQLGSSFGGGLDLVLQAAK